MCERNGATANPRGQTVLMHGMADTLGVDLDAAMRSGHLTPGALDGMVQSCRACHAHDACILWLVEQGPAADATPDYCLNTQELDFLRAATAGALRDMP